LGPGDDPFFLRRVRDPSVPLRTEPDRGAGGLDAGGHQEDEGPVDLLEVAANRDERGSHLRPDDHDDRPSPGWAKFL